MRTDSMFFLFLILLSVSTTGGQTNINAPSTSDLKRVTENLRIVARITNALYLHFAANQKEVHINDILAEVFQIPLEQLMGILQVESLMTIEEIRRMQNELKFQNFNFTTGLLSIGDDVLAVLGRIAASGPILKKAKQLTGNELREEVNKLATSMKPHENCTLDFETIVNFRKLIDNDAKEFKTPNISEVTDRLTKFKDVSARLVGCLQGVESLKAILEKSNIVKVSESYTYMMEAKEVAVDISKLVMTGAFFIIRLKEIKTNLQNSKPIWSGPNPKDVKSHRDAFGMLQTSAKAFSDYKTEKKDPIVVTHTAGYRSSEDMMTVFEDLKSDWFKKNIVRGASTKNLTEVLESYRHISELIGSLDTTWKGLIGQNDLGSSETEGATVWKEIKEFAMNASYHMSQLDKMPDLFHRCLTVMTTKVNHTDFNLFDEEQKPTWYLVSEYKKAVKAVDEIHRNYGNTLGSKGERLINGIVVLIDYGRNAINDDGQRVFPDVEIMSNLKMRVKMGFGDETNPLETLKTAAILVEHVSALYDHASKIPTSPTTTTIHRILQGVHAEQKVECFDSSLNDKGQLADLQIPLNTLKRLLNFPSDAVIDKFTTYLEKLSKVQEGFNKIPKMMEELRSKRTDHFKKLIQPLNDSKTLNENFGGSMVVLENLDDASGSRGTLLNIPKFNKEEHDIFHNLGLADWVDPNESMIKLMNEADETNEVARKVEKKDFTEMSNVFESVSKIRGLAGTPSKLREAYDLISKLEKPNKSVLAFLDEVMKYDLDFAKHQARLINARVTAHSLKQYFDEIFGHAKKETVTIEKHLPVSFVALICICVGFVLLVFIAIFGGYGLTEKGRAYYKDTYIYYFGKPEDFEKRWRYSLFRDAIDGKNALLDAAREGNTANMIKALKNGAYIDAYNKFGNTALHAAVKYGNADQVKLLIKHGADRALFNSKNMTPIQMLPVDYEKKYPKKIENYEKIKKLFKKYDNRSFRVIVPRNFPTSSFRIWPDESTDNKLTNKFLEAFRSIASDEPSPQTTHVIFKTDKDGILETDSMDVLAWIFQGTILVKEQWMVDCLNDETLIKKDTDYLIEKVRYKGVVYDTVLAWTEAMAKATMPYLQNAFVTVVAPDYQNLQTINTIVTNQGGILLNVFPYKQHFNIGSRPHLHAHRGPLFLIHDGTADMSAYKNDPDKMYTAFTEEEFLHFMLKRDINKETRPNPPNALINDEN